MAASNSMTLRATAAVVSGTHGRVVTVPRLVESVAACLLGPKVSNSSLEVSKSEHKNSLLTALSNKVRT